MSDTRWEYHVEIFDTDDFRNNRFKNLDIEVLNRLGADGWELVSSDGLIDAIAGPYGLGGAKTMRIALWFKREMRS